MKNSNIRKKLFISISYSIEIVFCQIRYSNERNHISYPLFRSLLMRKCPVRTVSSLTDIFNRSASDSTSKEQSWTNFKEIKSIYDFIQMHKLHESGMMILIFYSSWRHVYIKTYITDRGTRNRHMWECSLFSVFINTLSIVNNEFLWRPKIARG